MYIYTDVDKEKKKALHRAYYLKHKKEMLEYADFLDSLKDVERIDRVYHTAGIFTYDEQVDYMKEWIRTRMNFLREEINK